MHGYLFMKIINFMIFVDPTALAEDEADVEEADAPENGKI